MNKYVKNGLLFTGGFVCCGVFYTRAVLKSKMFRDAIVNAIGRNIELLVYDSTRQHSKMSYRRYYDDRYQTKEYTPVFDDIIIETRGEAETTLNKLGEIIDQYGMVSIADLYDLVGLKCSFTDSKYGWTDIRGAQVVRVRDGYKLKLPKYSHLR